ncbi:putative endoglucanase [Lineolata rhizophorae]|uniref:Putative endoglucanase n=1 Tax=Lineolata rhizophorae TaxID=578093 RepID=A0A6A6P634_9PEZI|nr:putative endoglucanase [Lineolata rhizophorae]
MRSSTSSFASAALFIASVAAHGHVQTIAVQGGETYQGWDPAMQYENPRPEIPAWSADNLDNGFVSPDMYSGPEIVCHKKSEPGQTYVQVQPGDVVSLTWNTWPESHKGPILDYIAPCGDDCTSVDKTSLMWQKMDEGALESGYDPGTWVTDDLIANDFTWDVTIPADLAAGKYVIRHEIIALHAAGQPNGAQNYPQCFNIEVTSDGAATLSPTGGEVATSFYTPEDPGILFNLYTQFDSYEIPGPSLWSALAKVRRHARDFFKL